MWHTLLNFLRVFYHSNFSIIKNINHDQNTIAVDIKEIAPINGANLIFVFFGVIKTHFHIFKMAL
jgi:hypothetical protein